MEENKKPENPQAFPVALAGNEKAGWLPEHVEGMTLRDYFAAKALPRIIAAEGYKAIHNSEEGFIRYSEKISQWAYGFADAMLKEREK